jgi:AcrR family transcriptional regulator
VDRPLRRDAEENRRRLLEAAAELFATRGLEASVEEIAHAAGVGMGTLYRRFPTKEALIDQLVDDLLDDVLAAGRRATQIADGTGLHAFLHDVATSYQARRGCISRLWTRPRLESYHVEFDAVCAELITKGQAAGRVRVDCVPTDILVLFWAIRGIVESTGDAAPEAWRRHVDIVLAGLHPSACPLAHAPVSDEQRHQIARSRRQHAT